MISDNLKYEDLIEYYNYRHKVKPGITGLSQVLGFIGAVKNIQSMKDRVQADIFYARHWSFWLDLKILWYTLRRLAGL
jgi:putative colanic acid biosynthesis UDP-glucose lipid carrier transferase